MTKTNAKGVEAQASRDDRIDELTRSLITAGSQRSEDEAAGGSLFVAFTDFCWCTAIAVTRDFFELWLAELHDEGCPDEAEVAAARKALETRS